MQNIQSMDFQEGDKVILSDCFESLYGYYWQCIDTSCMSPHINLGPIKYLMIWHPLSMYLICSSAISIKKAVMV